jgi:heptaprenyl diphosphate synthase
LTRHPGKANGAGPESDKTDARLDTVHLRRRLRPDTGKTVVLLGAFCLLLSTLEYLIPKPLPFIRIGLANLPLMLALDLLSPRYFVLLTLIKITGAGIVSGAIFSYVFVFSLLGSAASALVMYGLRRISAGSGRTGSNRAPRLSLAGIGVAGAMSSTGVQLFLARFLVFGEGVRYLIPPFLAVSLVTGCALGLFCEQFCRRSRWYRKIVNPESVHTREPVSVTPAPGLPARKSRREQQRKLRRDCWNRRFNNSELIIAGFIALLLFLFNASTPGRFLQFLFFWFCAWLSGRKNNPFITVSVIAGVVLVNLLVPYGRVLAEIGPLHVTAGSLEGGLRKGLTLEGLLMLSTAVIRGGPSSGVPAFFGGGRGIAGRPRFAVFRYAAIFGRFLGNSLSVFAALREGGGRVRPAHFIDDVDKLLLEMDETPMGMGKGKTDMGPVAAGREPGSAPAAEQPPSPSSSSVAGRLWLVVGLLITAAFMILPLKSL